MCGGGGFTASYERVYSGQSGGTVIPTRVYNNTRPEIGGGEIVDGNYIEYPINTATFAPYDGSILMSGSGNIKAASGAPTTNGAIGDIACGGGYGARGFGQVYGDWVANYSDNIDPALNVSDINSGNLVPFYFAVVANVDDNNPDLGQTITADGGIKQGSLWTSDEFAGLGGSAILTNGNSVTVTGTTGNIYGAIS